MPKSISDYSIEDIARILGGDVHGSGAGRYAMVPGPGHSAKDRSLRIDLGHQHPDGFVVHCHAGNNDIVCKDHVREKLSLPAFSKANDKRRPAKKKRATVPPIQDPKPIPESIDGMTPDEQLEAAMSGSSSVLSPEHVPGLKFVEAYPFADASGKVTYQNCRYLEDNGAGKKTFRPWHRANGKWMMGVTGIEQTPYRLDQFAKHPHAPIVVCEGEKDANNVRDLGYVTTNVAAGWWQKSAKYFSDREVIILGDFNKAGTERALEAATALHGTARSIKIIFLPGLDGRNLKDVFDWLEIPGNDANKLADICNHEPLWSPGATVDGYAAAALVVKEKYSDATPAKAKSWRDRFKLTKLFDVIPTAEPLWLIDGLIPSGPSLGVIFGKPKSGKTFVTADMFLHVAMGRIYCGCAVQQGAVIYITKEGVRGFQHRMMAMREQHNAGPEIPFYTAHEMPNFGTNNGDAEHLVLLIQKLLPQGQRVAAIVLDTLARTMPGQSDSDPAAMSMFVENCNTVAEAFKCFVGAVHHSPRSDDTRSRGSNVLDGAADVIISVTKDDATHISTARIEAIKDSEEGLIWRFQVTEKRNQKDGFTPLCETISNPHRNDLTETKAKPKMTGEEKRFFDILCEAILEAGQFVQASNTVPGGIKVVTRDHFKKCLLHRGFIDAEKPDSARAKVSKYINQLAGKKVIGADSVYVWLPKP